MSRLIDADAAIKALDALEKSFSSPWMDVSQVMWCAKHTIEVDVPTIDAVEVVRCRDCKYNPRYCDDWEEDHCVWMYDQMPEDDDYCSYGERRTE